jgi:hypothetical protein
LNFLPESIDVINSIACPDGSIIKGYLLNLLSMIAFYVQRSSDGNLCPFQISLSPALDKN